MESLFPERVNVKIEFNIPYGLSTDQFNGDIYV